MIEVPANETGKLRVFAVNGDSRGSGETQSFLSRLESSPQEVAVEAARLRRILGATFIDPTYTETVKIADVRDMGLSTYISTAMDVPSSALSSDRARLDALDGEVLLVLSRALGFEGQTLRPGPELTFIGCYTMAEVPLTGTVAAPKPEQMPTEQTPPATAPTPARQGPPRGLIVAGALALAAAVLLFLVGGRAG